MSNNTFHEIAIWQPSEEALQSMRIESSRLKEFYEQRKQFTDHVNKHVQEHIRHAVLLCDLLTSDLYLSLTPDQQESVDTEPDSDWDETGTQDSTTEDEHRKSKGMSRQLFKKLNSVYKKIQRLCHPDRTPYKRLHEISVQASILAEKGELTQLIVLFSVAKVESEKLKAMPHSSDHIEEYLELEREIETYSDLLAELTQDYDYATYYTKDRTLFLASALELACDDILAVLYTYVSRKRPISADLKDRLDELDPELLLKAYAVNTYSHNPTPIDDFGSMFGDTPVNSDTADMIKSLFPDED